MSFLKNMPVAEQINSSQSHGSHYQEQLEEKPLFLSWTFLDIKDVASRICQSNTFYWHWCDI